MKSPKMLRDCLVSDQCEQKKGGKTSEREINLKSKTTPKKAKTSKWQAGGKSVIKVRLTTITSTTTPATEKQECAEKIFLFI